MSGEDWLYLWSDGAARGNPGPAGAGGQARDSAGRVLLEVSDFLGEATSNVAEYQALIRTLEAVAGLGYRKVKVQTDSKLMAKQVVGAFKVKSRGLLPLVSRVKELLAAYDEAEVENVPRESNAACDALANRAIDAGLAGLKEPVLADEEATLF